jgi:hypothetical protein
MERAVDASPGNLIIREANERNSLIAEEKNDVVREWSVDDISDNLLVLLAMVVRHVEVAREAKRVMSHYCLYIFMM